jgi:DNA-binding MarR family transcriptional regulator
MLSQAPERTLRMSALAQRSNATLARLSHVVSRLEDRGLVERFPCPEDARATNARLTSGGWDVVVATAPSHVAHVRERVLDGLRPEQVRQLVEIGDALLARLDPQGKMTALYRPA